MASPPPVKPHVRIYRGIDPDLAEKAIDTVRNALPYMVFGPPLIHYAPSGEVHIDVPLMYHDYALDRVHFDPISRTPSPKGRPVHVYGVFIGAEEVKQVMDRILGELRVVDAAEFREPEDVWVVPLAWRSYIVAHIKVSRDGTTIIPDTALTAEVRRYVV